MYPVSLQNHIIEYCFRFTEIWLVFFLLCFTSAVHGETVEGHSNDNPQPHVSESKSPPVQEEQKQGDIDYFALTLEEIMNIKVDVASLFLEDELVVGSSVSAIYSDAWKRSGAKRTHEAFDNQVGVVNYPTFGGGPYHLAVRGYASKSSQKGIAYLLDGVPLNDIFYGTAIHNVPNWELGTLDKIEMIKGPGSAIYGSDAFHGVVSMKTFESNENTCSVDVGGGYPLYGEGNLKLSQGSKNGIIRLDMAASASAQEDLDMNYDYEDLDGAPGFGIPPKNGSGTREYNYTSESGMIKLRFNPSDKLKVKMAGYISDWDGRDHSGTRISGPFHTREADTDDSESLFLMGTGSVSYDFANNISITSSGYYWHADRTHYTDVPEDVIPVIGATDIRSIQKNDRKGFSLTAKQPANTLNLQWLLGLSFEKLEVPSAEADMKLTSGEWVDSVFHTIPSLGKEPQDGLSRDIDSAFGQIKWECIKETLYLIAGCRYDDYSDFGRQTTPRASLIYLPSKSSSIKALYGRAFRAAAGQEITSSGPTIKGDPDIEPETIDSYELIYMRNEDNWKLCINGFYSDWKDGIMAIDNPDYVGGSPPGSLASFPFIYENEGDNQAYGCEISLFYSMHPFALNFGFSYVKSEALDVIDPVDNTSIIDLEYSAFPDYSIIAGLQFSMEQQNITFYLNNRIYIGMEEYPSSLASSNRSPDDLPLYWRTDLNICKKISRKAHITLDIRNLLNRKNYVSSVYGMKDGFEEPGISVLLRAGYKF